MSIGDWGAKTAYSEWCYLISKWRVFILVRLRTENTNAICEKSAGLRSGNFSDLNSACSKMLVTVKIFQFHDMLNESERYRVTANGLKYKLYCRRIAIELRFYFIYKRSLRSTHAGCASLLKLRHTVKCFTISTIMHLIVVKLQYPEWENIFYSILLLDTTGMSTSVKLTAICYRVMFRKPCTCNAKLTKYAIHLHKLTRQSS
jgi:hypothetical protein